MSIQNSNNTGKQGGAPALPNNFSAKGPLKDMAPRLGEPGFQPNAGRGHNRGKDGTQLAAFRHTKNYQGYPDFPCVVNWKSNDEQSLWIPIDRTLVDGYGNVVADLGSYESLVKEKLQWGETKQHIAVQAFAVDLCGDHREELVLYQPYNGKSILIFTQSDSDAKVKPYVHEKDAYNIRSYF